jgi:hypothetical protein
MFSIENFYYILHKNLLEPLNLQTVMYQTFGSLDPRDIRYDRYYKNRALYGKPMVTKHSCYYLDQEPVQPRNVLDLTAWSTEKQCKILVNSEKSQLKKDICKEQQCNDWYYFFHGFAALDWYRDAQYLNNDIEWTRPYISLNRLHVNDRSYRLNLIARLAQQKLLSHGHVSLHLEINDHGSWMQELENPNTKLSLPAQELIKQYIQDPLIVDRQNISGHASADFGHQEFELWKSGLWHIVTETVFYYNKLHLTEKIFKPIVAQRPFMLAAAPGNLAYLKSYGFKTFDRWIDESYDTIEDPDQRLQAIVDQTHKLCAMSDSELRQMHKEMQPVLEHNFNHLWTTFRHHIVDELVNNFETCVRLWNNGRIDGKELPLQNVDLARVKEILLR